MKNIKSISLFVLIFFLVAAAGAQNEDYGLNDTINKDDLGVVTDRFQEMFFQALSQRAIENNQRAISILQSLEPTAPNAVAVNFELGKNYLDLKEYNLAQKYFLTASEKKPDDVDILSQLLEVYQKSENAIKGAEIAEQLSEFDKKYLKDLAGFQWQKKEYSKALKSLDRLKITADFNAATDSLRDKFFYTKEAQNAIIDYLNDKIVAQPENLKAYQDLILVYDRAGKTADALEVANQLTALEPESPAAHFILYQDYLQKEQNDQAATSMKLVLESYSLDEDLRNRVAKDFSALVKAHPEYESDFTQAVRKNPSDLQLSDHYKDTDSEKALQHLESALKEDPGNYKLIRETIELQLEMGQYAEAAALARQKSELFPTQALLFLYQGRAENGLEAYKKAIESLESGLDYIIENESLEYLFYKELVIAQKGLGQTQKASKLQQRVDALQQKIKK